MEFAWLIIIIISLIVLFNTPAFEGMTNKDLMSTLNAFSKSSKKTDIPHEEPIYGPKVPEIEEPIPASSRDSKNSTNMYPDIYGPEITPVPGKKKDKHEKHEKHEKHGKTGKHESHNVNDETYEFNPDFKNAFPAEENEPQPFLTDFSKFQH